MVKQLLAPQKGSFSNQKFNYQAYVLKIRRSTIPKVVNIAKNNFQYLSQSRIFNFNNLIFYG